MGQRRQAEGNRPNATAEAMRETLGTASPTIASAVRPAECQVRIRRVNRDLRVFLNLRWGFTNQHAERQAMLDFQDFDMAIPHAVEMLEHFDDLRFQQEVARLKFGT